MSQPNTASPDAEHEAAIVLMNPYRNIGQVFLNELNPEGVKGNTFSSEFISGMKGRGLVSKIDIPRGYTIFREIAMIVGETPKDFGSWKEYDIMISQELREMPADWKRRFFTLPTPDEGEKGKFASRFENGSIPVDMEGRQMRLLGFDAASLNHACIPNAQIMFTRRSQRHLGPILIICRACRDIKKDEEITVPYGFFHSVYEDRQVLTLDMFGFSCACHDCLNPKNETEGHLGYIDEFTAVAYSARLADHAPAHALRILHGLLLAHIAAGICDNRFGHFLERAAMICGIHSDEARVDLFMRYAQMNYLIGQGDQGLDYRRTAHILGDARLLPRYGMTNRGWSRKFDAAFLAEHGEEFLQVAFMLNADPDGYLKISEVEGYMSSDGSHTEQGSNPGNLDDLVNDLQLEKEEDDKARRQQSEQIASASSKKKKSKGKGTVNGKGKKKKR